VGTDYVIDHLWVWGAIFLYSLLIVVVLSSLALAFSSMTARRFYAAFGLVVSYFISLIMSSIIVNEFGEEKGSAVSIHTSFSMVASKLFDVPGISYDYDWTYNLLALLLIVTVCAVAVVLKIWRTELSE